MFSKDNILSRIFIYIALIFYLIQSDLISSQIEISPNIKSPISYINPNDIIDNPSKLYYIERNNVATSYIPSSFGINELNINSFIATYKDSSTFHLFAIDGSFGEKYNSSNLKYSFAYALFENFIPSVSVNYHYLLIPQFNDYNNVTVDFNGVLNLSEFLNFGFSLSNIFNSSFTSNNTITKQRALFGLEYQFEDDFRFHFGSEIRIENNAGLIIGFIKSFDNLGKIGLSYSTEPQMIELNTMIDIMNDFGMIYNLNYHNYLGITHQFGLGYEFD